MTDFLSAVIWLPDEALTRAVTFRGSATDFLSAVFLVSDLEQSPFRAGDGFLISNEFFWSLLLSDLAVSLLAFD